MTEGENGERETMAGVGEDALIARIQAWTKSADSGGEAPGRWARVDRLAGIGDDTAIIRAAGSKTAPPTALTTDLLVEGTHFTAEHPPEDLGFKSATASLSDLASAGAWPTWALVSLAVPSETPIDWVEGFYRGMGKALAPYGCACLGGNVSRADRIFVSVAMGGACHPMGARALRSKAKPGMGLYATGALGDSAAGLAFLSGGKMEGLSARAQRDAERLIEAHRRPSARVAAGLTITRWCKDVAMMDLSDGLATDAPRLAKASGCALEIEAARLPAGKTLNRAVDFLDASAVAFAWFGGEDYELLFATAQPEETWLEQVRASEKETVRVTRIGRVVEGEGVRLVDENGAAVELSGEAFLHFD